MKFKPLLLSVALLIFVTPVANAESDDQLDAIRGMGSLYGIALPCQYLDQTRRIKQGMVDNLPKKRYLGQVFEQATNESFLEFTKAGTGCPGEDAMAEQVEAAILRLQQVFADPAQ